MVVIRWRLGVINQIWITPTKPDTAGETPTVGLRKTGNVGKPQITKTPIAHSEYRNS